MPSIGNRHSEVLPKTMKQRFATPVSLSPNSLPEGERDAGSLREYQVDLTGFGR
ncbi:MAG: hypothetical protein Q8O37_17740 [Sulfuricellaceae bacterium]|nr:hypothetical protein [Sulfuricellaceae bacterium]